VTATTTTPEIIRYRDAVRAALADLSAEDRDDLMEDVESHLTEVAAENDGSLARLGSPADYAAELRTSAGLPAPGQEVRTSFWQRRSAALANSAAGRGIEHITSTRWWQSFRSFLPELRPGWWVLRGYLVAWAIAGVFFEEPALGLVPRILDSALIGLVVTGFAIWASVRMGKRAQVRPPRGARWFWAIAGTVLLLIVTLGLLVSASGTSGVVYSDGGQQTGLVGVSNVYVFDSEGRPLTGVQLFDQDGNPLQVYQDLYDANGMPIQVRRYVDPNGLEVYNVYPREGDPFSVRGPRMSVPRLTPPTSPSAAPGRDTVTPSPTSTPR